MLLTRRRILEQTLALPLLPIGMSIATPWVISEDNYLSRESADGFRRMLTHGTIANRPFIIVAGASRPLPPISAKLRSFTRRGGWVIWEQAPQTFPAHNHVAHKLYVRYSWPVTALVRSFGQPVTISCAPRDVIACFNGEPVAYRRGVGEGGFIYLGSMLGPHLRAADREALELALALLAPSAAVRV